MNTKHKKITRATIKSFVQKNNGKLLIKHSSDLCLYTDGVQPVNDEFKPVKLTNDNVKYNLGIEGAWLVGNSRDYFNKLESNVYTGYYIFNSCGSFSLAIKK